MKKLAFAAMLFTLSFTAKAVSNSTCEYPANTKYQDLIAQYSNENGWTVHCNARFIGAYYAKNGLNQKDLAVIAAKSNQVLAQGQAPITGTQYGQGCIELYQLFSGQGIAQVAAAMTMQVVNGFFGATNQFGSFNIIAPPQWYTDPACYNLTGSIANVLRNNTITNMDIGFTALIMNSINNFTPNCDGMSTNYQVAFGKVCDFFDNQYAFCNQMMAEAN